MNDGVCLTTDLLNTKANINLNLLSCRQSKMLELRKKVKRMPRCTKCKKLYNDGATCPRCGETAKNLTRKQRKDLQRSSSSNLKKHGSKRDSR